eukprot:TRINITY_DN346_c0_g1_i2.p1 TRINITY_DN346_c0_g1~~TRINITY_DN346_c0_g1_i2.p1  ORF type:complete len:516 (-),score=70.28 TRINITY_DN346_c0_g1_i2:1578-3125(-)
MTLLELLNQPAQPVGTVVIIECPGGTDEEAKQLYKNHINFMVNRVNTFNGRAYKDDPTIFAWNIINEPRCRSDACVQGQAMSEWIDEMAAYIKSLDPNHLLTVGEEGFYKVGCFSGFNPDAWAESSGQDSPRDHSSQYIDYVSSHVWLDNWARVDLDFLRNWIEGKIQEANSLGKPLVLQEFGKGTESMTDAAEIASVRDPVYELVYSMLEEQLATGGPFRGALFWTWNYGFDDHEQFFGQGIRKLDSTWNIVEQHGQQISIRRLEAQPIPGCTPGRGPPSNSNRFIDPSELIYTNFETCCESDCNSLYGEVYGQQSLETVQTSSPQECCDLCKLSDGCEGYSWCGCQAGCLGYGFQDCVMKTLPFKEYPITYVTGEHVKFVSGVPLTSINSDLSCQIGAPCIQQLDQCSADEFANSIQCADETCGVVSGHSRGEVILYQDYEVETGNPVSSIAECCAACRTVPGCNSWSFCTELDVCRSKNNERGLSCILKTATDTRLWSEGPRQAWVSGYLQA